MSVTPFTLLAGTTYTLAGYGEGPTFDPYVRNPSGGYVFGSGISFVQPHSGAASGFGFPIAGAGGVVQDVCFGPNFVYTPVPEPSALLALALPALALLLRRKRA